ncbi:hypothetical protein T439DRAFT_337016 [Meredithblackwellia eburnea MCA 4105]
MPQKRVSYNCEYGCVNPRRRRDTPETWWGDLDHHFRNSDAHRDMPDDQRREALSKARHLIRLHEGLSRDTRDKSGESKQPWNENDSLIAPLQQVLQLLTKIEYACLTCAPWSRFDKDCLQFASGNAETNLPQANSLDYTGRFIFNSTHWVPFVTEWAQKHFEEQEAVRRNLCSLPPLAVPHKLQPHKLVKNGASNGESTHQVPLGTEGAQEHFDEQEAAPRNLFSLKPLAVPQDLQLSHLPQSEASDEDHLALYLEEANHHLEMNKHLGEVRFSLPSRFASRAAYHRHRREVQHQAYHVFIRSIGAFGEV